MEITKKLLLKDLKLQKFTDINTVNRLFNFFVSGIGDLEKSSDAINLYRELKWPFNPKCFYYDVINSFWTTFSFAMHSKFEKLYPISNAGNVKIYKNPYKGKGYTYDSFPKMYLTKDKNSISCVNSLCDDYPKIFELAAFCHCIANFMPCPDKNFNSAKGGLNDVRDYFPLMIDKIQNCIDYKKELKYKSGKNEITISVPTIKEWYNFFINAYENYCLDMYYKIEEINGEKKLIGIKFFKTQTLTNPCPKTEEIKECLDNMINCIICRASKILKNTNKLQINKS